MKKKKLVDVLGPPGLEMDSLRWQTAVPIGTNLFLLIELAQFAFVGALIALVTLCSGIWVTEGGLYLDEILAMTRIAMMLFLGIMAGFVCIGILFFGNRYFAVYNLGGDGVYHEGSRGSDDRTNSSYFHVKPYPVVGTLRAIRTKSRYLPWGKIDTVQSVPFMRVIILRRGRWSMAKLYTPDNETHEKAVAFIKERLAHP